MAVDREFSSTTSGDLRQVLDALLAREPLFHHRGLVATRADFDRETAVDFWEVGASGRRYDRDDVWDALASRLALEPIDQAQVEQWSLIEPQVRPAGAQTYLLTYTLLVSRVANDFAVRG